MPPACTAALHAADFGLSGPSAKQAETRLTGSVIEPCAAAGLAVSTVSASGAMPVSAIPVALRRTVIVGVSFIICVERGHEAAQWWGVGRGHGAVPR